MQKISLMKLPLLLLGFFLLIGFSGFCQGGYTQTIRGTVIDKESKEALIGATVVLLKSNPLNGTTTDINGKFKLENVPLGRHDIKVSFIGYRETVIPNIIVNSGKEVVLNIELVESVISKEEIVIVGKRNKDKPINEMATVSARVFTVDETQRYAGALGDPARMAANFAGVSAPNDARNDIIIRGNSPIGLLWRLEGVDIPSPNHFSTQGATGGPVSILNNNMLRNSDFFTGAWPAEYGNATSGAFDLKMRNGNNEKREYTGQVGFNGFEAMVEGPFSKDKGSSYLAAYRYSALGFFQMLGINLGPAGVPKYQDLSFKLNFPGSKNSQFEVFGVGGISNIELLDSKKKANTLSYGQNNRDVYFGSDMGVGGISYTRMLKNASYIKTILSSTVEVHRVKVDSLSDDRKPHGLYKENSRFYKTSVHTIFNRKINASNTIRSGIIFSNLRFNTNQQAYTHHAQLGEFWRTLVDDNGGTYMGQAYSQWKHDFSDKVSLLAGLQYEHFFLNNTNSIEPRGGIKYNFRPKQSLNFGYGLHGQIQPLAFYFYQTQTVTGEYIKTNEKLGFTKSHHFVLGYDYLISSEFRFKAETYYQYLFNVPIRKTASSFSMLNHGSDFAMPLIDNLENKGTGYNYGLELTLEKFFSDNYYFLITTSIFDSKYRGSDNILRNTAFNSNYTINALAGREFNVGRNNIITISGKISTAGGRRYSPVDREASQQRNTIRTIDSEAWSLQFPTYFKMDARIGYKLNTKSVTQEWALDVINITNQKNILNQAWDPKLNDVVNEYQLGIFPMILYRIQF